MKLKDLVPESPWIQTQEARLNSMTGLWSAEALKKSGEIFRPASYGTETAAVNSWIRSQYAYRQNLIVDLLTIGHTIAEIRSPVSRIGSEVFRRGMEWAPKFALKCEICETEYSESVEECEVCAKEGNSGSLRTPDEEQKKRLELFFDDCNIFDQSLVEVFKMFHFDVNIVDDGYIHLVKEYWSDDESKDVFSKVVEIRRLHPALMEFDLDQEGLPKNSHFVCLIHRERDPADREEHCGVDGCGRLKVPVMYKYMQIGASSNNPKGTMYLLDSEVIHHSKFSPSETYGFSPVLTIFEKALSIRGMDSFLYRYFFERKMPASMLMVFTDNPESLAKERASIEAKTRQDPNYVPMVAVSSRNNRGRVDLVRMFHTLQEMDYLPVRQEIRERIAAMWGVSPAWQGAPEAFGGLSTQTTQLTVMSRVVEEDQQIYHNKIFPQILEAFGVTDWKLELQQPEEKAEATRITFAQQRVGIANMLLQMGFDIKIKSEKVGMDDIEFVVSGEAKKQDMFGGGGFGGFGGFGGGGGPGGSPEGESGEDSADLQFMQKSDTWLSQIASKGYPLIEVKGISKSGDALIFLSKSDNRPYIAKFLNGKLVEVEKMAGMSGMHQHNGHPLYPIAMRHDTMARKSPVDKDLYENEEADVEDFS